MSNSNFIKKSFGSIGIVFGTKVISMMLFMITDVLIARFLKKQSYGEWSFFYAVITIIFYFFWFGVNQASKVYIAKSNSSEIKEVKKSSWRLRVIVTIVWGLILLIAFPGLVRLLGYPDKYKNLFSLFEAGIVIACINSFLEYFKQISMGEKKFRFFAVCNILEYASVLLSVIVILILNRNVIGVGWAYAVGNVIAFAIIYFIFKQQISGVRAKKETVIGVFRYSLPLSFLGIGGAVMAEMDTIMLGIMSTTEQIAIYAIAKSLTTKASQINYSITCGTIQDFANITPENIREKKHDFKKVVKFNMLITLAICLGFFCLSKLAISIVYGESYKSAANLIYVLMPYYFFMSVTNLYSNFTDFYGKANMRLIAYLITIFLNLVFNFMLIPQYGAYGAAIASGISLVPYAIFLYVMTKQIFDNIMRKDNVIQE